ncbi:MAG TPA: Nramp family divalent metal transporter [Coriobacteriia bacterium]|jgi:NRAMP (natural resistance-associated macrophage protein)-like metal ion transporter
MMERLKRINPRWAAVLAFLAVIGPGIITANVDNDAGGIATYSIAGASFGYTLLWSLIPITIALIVVQEMASRLGVMTGKGFADLIREKWGIRVTFYLMIALLFVNLSNTMAEFAGWAGSMEIFGVSKFVSVPIAALVVWLLVVRGSYNSVEKIFLFFTVIYVTYVISGFLARPDWGLALHQTLVPPISFKVTYWVTLVGVIGTTIAPWMQFYLQSAVVEKGIKPKDYTASATDVIVGCIITDVVAMFIIVACAATLNKHGITVSSAENAALALEPLAGKYASVLFAIGFANASLFAASILPLSTAYTVAEGLGWESGVNRTFGEAPQFNWIYTGMIFLGASAIILIPQRLLIPVIFGSQVLNGVLVPVTAFFALRLVNDRSLLGEHVNGRWYNYLAWASVLACSAAAIFMMITALFPGLMPS